MMTTLITIKVWQYYFSYADSEKNNLLPVDSWSFALTFGIDNCFASKTENIQNKHYMDNAANYKIDLVLLNSTDLAL